MGRYWPSTGGYDRLSALLGNQHYESSPCSVAVLKYKAERRVDHPKNCADLYSLLFKHIRNNKIFFFLIALYSFRASRSCPVLPFPCFLIPGFFNLFFSPLNRFMRGAFHCARSWHNKKDRKIREFIFFFFYARRSAFVSTRTQRQVPESAVVFVWRVDGEMKKLKAPQMINKVGIKFCKRFRSNETRVISLGGFHYSSFVPFCLFASSCRVPRRVASRSVPPAAVKRGLGKWEKKKIKKKKCSSKGLRSF